MVLIHVNGIFEHCVRFCRCKGSISEHEQLFRNGLFSSTFDRPATAFTMGVLDYYGIDSMECKTSAQSFFQKLRRMTNNAFPDEVPVSFSLGWGSTILLLTFLKNRYQELIRVSRQMRKLEVSKRFGSVYGHSSSAGSLAIFCPSCPQPGINLPPDWKSLPDWVTSRTIAVDGNFHADHIKMRRPDLDIKLSNGQGYMVDDVRYKEYLSVAKEPRVVRQLLFFSFFTFEIDLQNQRSSCRNHRAVNAANSNTRRNLDATGIVACCCARHGCFIPTSVCDMQKGER
jgi:hypothetical protein